MGKCTTQLYLAVHSSDGGPVLLCVACSSLSRLRVLVSNSLEEAFHGCRPALGSPLSSPVRKTCAAARCVMAFHRCSCMPRRPHTAAKSPRKQKTNHLKQRAIRSNHTEQRRQVSPSNAITAAMTYARATILHVQYLYSIEMRCCGSAQPLSQRRGERRRGVRSRPVAAHNGSGFRELG